MKITLISCQMLMHQRILTLKYVELEHSPWKEDLGCEFFLCLPHPVELLLAQPDVVLLLVDEQIRVELISRTRQDLSTRHHCLFFTQKYRSKKKSTCFLFNQETPGMSGMPFSLLESYASSLSFIAHCFKFVWFFFSSAAERTS